MPEVPPVIRMTLSLRCMSRHLLSLDKSRPPTSPEREPTTEQLTTNGLSLVTGSLPSRRAGSAKLDGLVDQSADVVLGLVTEQIPCFGRVDTEVLSDRVDQFEHVDLPAAGPRTGPLPRN